MIYEYDLLSIRIIKMNFEKINERIVDSFRVKILLEKIKCIYSVI